MAKNKIALLILMLAVMLLPTGCGREESAPAPTTAPTATAAATESPTVTPTETPTESPTEIPTVPPPTEVPATPPPETQAPTAEATIEPVFVQTARYELTYSGTLAEYITYKEIEDTDQTDLAFRVELGKRSEPIFTLVLNSEEGDIVSMIDDASGGKIPVAFFMDELPPNLNPSEEDLFCRAQETVNEVIASIVLK